MILLLKRVIICWGFLGLIISNYLFHQSLEHYKDQYKYHKGKFKLSHYIICVIDNGFFFT